jgi:voltage-dependent anion channel protein 2
MATKFADVVKSAKDLLSRNYSYDKKVEVTTKADNGVSFTADAKLSSKGAAANLKGSYKQKSGLSLDSVKVGTNNTVSTEFSLKGYVPNADFTFKATDGARASAKSTGKLGLTYTVGNTVVTAETDAINGPTLDATACSNFGGVVVGASVSANLGGGFDLTGYDLVAAYKTDAFTAAVKTAKQLSAVDVSYFHKVNSTLSTGAQASFALDRKDTSAFTVAFGGAYKLDGDSTVEAKVTSAGIVSANYQQKLNSMASLTLATEVNAADIGSDAHKFGVSLKLSQ